MSFIATLLAKVTGEALKTGGEIAKTYAEIPKTIVETKQAILEVDKLEYEKHERQRLIYEATFDDVKKYDPKIAELERLSREDPCDRKAAPQFQPYLAGLVPILIVFGAVGLWLVFDDGTIGGGSSGGVRSSHWVRYLISGVPLVALCVWWVWNLFRRR